MTKSEFAALQRLREKGYAVIVWTPEELRNAEPRRVQDASVEQGWDIIEALQ